MISNKRIGHLTVSCEPKMDHGGLCCIYALGRVGVPDRWLSTLDWLTVNERLNIIMRSSPILMRGWGTGHN